MIDDTVAAPAELSPLLTALKPAGINVFGIASPAQYDAAVGPARQTATLAPDARSILVLGSGGPGLWRAFVGDLEAHHAHLLESRHPLDAFVRRVVLAADPLLGDTPRRWFWAAADAPIHLDFRVLAQVAGLGSSSRLGLLMHPAHGPWLGLRAACFLGLELPPNRPGGPDLCDGCEGPCLAACPGEAFPGGRWDVDLCASFHTRSDLCSTSCHARQACPQGMASRYPAEAVLYHSDPAAGRQWLRRHLGLDADTDPLAGETPLWGTWRKVINVKG